MAQAGAASGTREAGLVQAVSGFRLLFDAMSLLRRERGLWRLAAIPLLLALVALTGASAAVVSQAAWIWEIVNAWQPVLEAGAWYTWLWIGPAKAGLLLAGGLLFAAASATAIVLAFLVANVIAAPVLDLLSQRVELVEAGRLVESEEAGIAAVALDIGRSLSNELRRLLFLASLWAGLFVLGLVIPGGQLVAPPLMVVLTMLFLPMEYAGHVLDRRQVSFRERRLWLRAHLPRMAGFGGAALITCLIPGLNFLMMPGLVVAGTLLAVRYPPEIAHNEA